MQEQSTNLQFTALVQTNKAPSLSVFLSTSQSAIEVKAKCRDIKHFTNITKQFANRPHWVPVSTFFLHSSLMKSHCFRFIVHKYTGASQKRCPCLDFHKLNSYLISQTSNTNSLTYIVNWVLIKFCHGPKSEHALVDIPGPFDANVQPFQQGLYSRQKTGIRLFKPAGAVFSRFRQDRWFFFQRSVWFQFLRICHFALQRANIKTNHWTTFLIKTVY